MFLPSIVEWIYMFPISFEAGINREKTIQNDVVDKPSIRGNSCIVMMRSIVIHSWSRKTTQIWKQTLLILRKQVEQLAILRNLGDLFGDGEFTWPILTPFFFNGWLLSDLQRLGMKIGHVHFSITWKGPYRLGCSPVTVNTRSVSIFMYGILLAFSLLTLLPCRGYIPTEKNSWTKWAAFKTLMKFHDSNLIMRILTLAYFNLHINMSG